MKVVTEVRCKYTDKIVIRDSITMSKYNYLNTGSNEYLIQAALLKGLYLAVGGQKGIVLTPKVDYVVQGACIAFTYMYKLDNGKIPGKAVEWLIKKLKEPLPNVPMSYDRYCTSNEDIAHLASEIIFRNHIEDIVVNKVSVYSTVVRILNRLERR